MTELWKDIMDFFGLYEISDAGRVRNKISGRLLSLNSLDKDGYVQITLYKNKIPYKRKVHRLVVQGFINKIEFGFEVNHKNAIKHCNHRWNLEIVTSSQNKKHAWDNGLIDRNSRAKGEDAGLTKLNENQVRQIRSLAENKKLSYQQISKLYSVTGENVSAIVNRKTWKHI